MTRRKTFAVFLLQCSHMHELDYPTQKKIKTLEYEAMPMIKLENTALDEALALVAAATFAAFAGSEGTFSQLKRWGRQPNHPSREQSDV